MSDKKQVIFNVSSGFGHRTQCPLVQVLIEAADWSTQMSPAEARSLAFNLLGAAEAAEHDTFFVTFLRAKIGADDEGIALLLSDFREWRQKEANHETIPGPS